MTANIAASVRRRLLNLARAQERPFQEVLQFYVMERFLYRLSRSAHADSFVLKGALETRRSRRRRSSSLALPMRSRFSGAGFSDAWVMTCPASQSLLMY